MNTLKTKLKQLALAAFAAVLGFAANAATEQSETIDTTYTNQINDYTVNGTHFTINNNNTYADSDGMYAYNGITVTAKNNEYITKVVITCGYSQQYVTDADTTVSSGTKTITNGGGTITVTDVNASTFTFTSSKGDPQFKQFVVYYLESAPAAGVPYLAASVDEGTHEVTFTNKTCGAYEVVTDTTTAFESNTWYVVSDDVTNANRIVVTGTAHLILTDGKTLTATKGITVSEGNTHFYLDSFCIKRIC